ncbi:MAG: triose-phosphate isomerase [Nevskiales bacterium]
MSRRKLVAGNWKMHGSVAMTEALVKALSREKLGCDVLVCPPYPYLAQAVAFGVGGAVAVGAQDICEKTGQGAFTGEVSGPMLAEIGCTYTIVGHSERRQFFGDTDQRVAEKFKAAQAAGLIPILCVGEILSEREANQTEAVLARQLMAAIELNGIAAFERAVIAYEPVWAIGTGKTASAAQAQEAHAFLRAQFAGKDAKIAARLRILYGGSVKPDNASALFTCPDVDGGLIGGASLDADQFLAICRAAI